MSVLKIIQSLCNEKEISIPKLEKDLGLGNGAIYKWNKSSPSIDKLQKIADYFNVWVDYLLGNSEFKTREEYFRYLQNEIEEIQKNEENFKNSPLNPYYNLTQDEIDKIESYKAYLISQRNKKENSAMGE